MSEPNPALGLLLTETKRSLDAIHKDMELMRAKLDAGHIGTDSYVKYMESFRAQAHLVHIILEHLLQNHALPETFWDKIQKDEGLK